MTRFCCDTNVLIAAACPWHVHHQSSRSAIDRRRGTGEELVVGAHSLVEMYSVLTRIPEWRMRPKDAAALIRANFGDVPIVQLPVREVWKSLEEAPQHGVQGGRIHDALIARCAIHGGASTLLTWNVRHFSVFATEIHVTQPPP